MITQKNIPMTARGYYITHKSEDLVDITFSTHFFYAYFEIFTKYLLILWSALAAIYILTSLIMDFIFFIS